VTARALLLSCFILGAAAGADERYDHRGSLGLLFGPGVAFKDEVVGGQIVDDSFRFPLYLGATMAVAYAGNEVLAESITTFGGAHVDFGGAVGFREYFGEEQVKTFFTLEAAFHITPTFTAGPRASFGIQYDMLPMMGVFALFAADVGLGGGVRFSAETAVGIQLRTYVLE
jgi:hypothetical protein